MTLLVSSHILAELDEYADRLLVLQQGKLLQSGPLRDSVVATEVREIEAVLSEPAEPWQDRLASLTGVVSVRSEETTLSFAIRGGDPDQRRILAELVAAGVPVVEYRRRLESFQDKYLEMVRGRA
jgi:ABC-2 type transport system ATP-binding protein